MGKIQIDEAEHTRLVEAAGQVEQLTTELAEVKNQLAEATKPPEDDGRPPRRTTFDQIQESLAKQKHDMDVLRARESARDIIAEELHEGFIAPATKARLTTSLLADLPLTEAGELDEVALRDKCVAERDAAELETAEALESAGFGKPTGLGAYTPPAGGETNRYQDQIAEGVANAFGLSEAESKTAVKGR
jgi:hypothetical protein